MVDIQKFFRDSFEVTQGKLDNQELFFRICIQKGWVNFTVDEVDQFLDASKTTPSKKHKNVPDLAADQTRSKLKLREAFLVREDLPENSEFIFLQKMIQRDRWYIENGRPKGENSVPPEKYDTEDDKRGSVFRRIYYNTDDRPRHESIEKFLASVRPVLERSTHILMDEKGHPAYFDEYTYLEDTLDMGGETDVFISEYNLMIKEWEKYHTGDFFVQHE